MPRQQLNLTALRTFEAAARHESFKDAAAELCVTPVAVTRHIKQLEASLGLRLFERIHRGVVLTEGGRELMDELQPAFAAIDQGVERARQRSGRDTLRIGSDVAFARHWLGPRLEAFHALHPEIRVDLQLHDDDNEDLDGIIFYGFRQRYGRDRFHLACETVSPVCSPALLEGSTPLARPSDLARHCLLHDDSDDWWRRWLEVAGVQEEASRNRIFFSHDRLYEAAIEGRGVLMGDDIVYGDDLADGRLVRLFAETVEGNHFILTVRSSLKRQALDAFVAWILAACQDHKVRMKQVIGL